MKKELQNKLFKKYPSFFKQRFLPIGETAMSWGIMCGDGWFWLLDKMCNYLHELIRNNPHSYPDIEFIQIKEKFGGLRIYYTLVAKTEKQWKKIKHRFGLTYQQYLDNIHEHRNYIDGVISFTEDLSYYICENCGSSFSVKTREINGWLSTLCNDCYRKEKK